MFVLSLLGADFHTIYDVTVLVQLLEESENKVILKITKIIIF